MLPVATSLLLLEVLLLLELLLLLDDFVTVLMAPVVGLRATFGAGVAFAFFTAAAFGCGFDFAFDFG